MTGSLKTTKKLLPEQNFKQGEFIHHTGLVKLYSGVDLLIRGDIDLFNLGVLKAVRSFNGEKCQFIKERRTQIYFDLGYDYVHNPKKLTSRYMAINDLRRNTIESYLKKTLDESYSVYLLDSVEYTEDADDYVNVYLVDEAGHLEMFEIPFFRIILNKSNKKSKK